MTILFRTLFLIGFFGLFRIGEIAEGDHVIKAKDVFIAQNKSQVLIVLYSSKTHGKNSRPQEVRIKARMNANNISKFCPVISADVYSRTRPPYSHDDDQYFVYADSSPVHPAEVRKLLKHCISRLGLDPDFYDTHSLRIGRATEQFKDGVNLERIKKDGRWVSNAVYKYLRY